MEGFIPFAPAMASAGSDAQIHCKPSEQAERNGVSLCAHSPTPWLLATPQELLDDYLSRGLACLDQLNCHALIAIVDSRRAETFVAIDPMGIASLSYHIGTEGVGFSTNPLALAKSVGATQISRQQIFDYLFFHMIPAPNSAFKGLKKLLPGQVLRVEADAVYTETYWRPSFNHKDLTGRDADRQLHELISASVRRMSSHESVGAFLSGGLDSSTVAGFLAANLESQQAQTFSIGFGVDGYDELEYARIANRHFGCKGHELVARSEDILESFESIAAAYGEPFGNSSVVPTYLCAKLARQYGISTLLAGDGGDELFAGNERYAKQRIFEFYKVLPERIRARIIEPIASSIADDSSFFIARKLKSYVDQARISLPRRFEAWNFAYREGVSHMLTPEYSESIDIESPFTHMQSVYDEFSNEDQLDRMLAYDWKYTLADNDLRKVTKMCELADIQVCFPLLDKALVEFSTRIPSAQKLKGNKLRYFYKRSMRDFLPREILNKEKHGFGIPFGVWLQQSPDLNAMIFEKLDNLKRRGIFQDSFIDNLTRSQASGAESYHGYFVWDLAILEQWLATNQLEV